MISYGYVSDMFRKSLKSARTSDLERENYNEKT